jgi:ankyrin repeat protein/ubiquinone/menaquinone biosynthesis C-methylase UbiE
MFRAVFIFLSFLFFFHAGFGQDLVNFKRHYSETYYWTKKEAAKQLKNNKFWGEFKPGDVIADIGAYSGHISLAISMFYEGLTFYLQEAQPDRLNRNGFYEMKKHFTGIAGKETINKFHFVIGDNFHTNLPDSSFDKILMNSVFEYVSRYDLYLADLRSKLKSNGKIYIKTDNPFPPEYFDKIFSAYGFRCEKNTKGGGWLQMVFVPSGKKAEIKDIFDAVIQKDYAQTKAFLEKGVSAASALGVANLLQIAGSISQNEKIIQLLIDHGALKSKPTKFFVYNPIGKLSASGEFETVKILLENGAQPGEDALMMAAWFSHNVKLVKLLVDKGAKIYGKDNNSNEVLLAAAQGGDFEIVKYLVGHPDTKDLHKKDVNGQNILQWSAYAYDLRILRMLLDEKSFDVAEKDKQGMSVLMHAVYGGNLETIKFLIEEKKMDVNEKNNAGLTALHYAYDPEIIDYLVSKGAK